MEKQKARISEALTLEESYKVPISPNISNSYIMDINHHIYLMMQDCFSTVNSLFVPCSF